MAEQTTEPAPAWPSETRQLRIGDLRIDLRYRRVLLPDAEIELPHRMFELLLLFAAEPHSLHTRVDLFRRIWSGVIVEDANLSQSVWMLRKALGEERKGWIRTVAKRGYVFEPPTSVDAIKESSGATAASDSLSLDDASSEQLHELQPRSRPLAGRGVHRSARFLAIGALLLIVAVAAVMHRGTTQTAAPAPLSVALLAVEDPGVAADARWPATLLHAWLEWKLSALPEVTLLTQAHIAADASIQTTTQVVLLASGPVANDPTRLFLRARFESGGKPHHLEVQGPPEDVAALVDTLSKRVLDQLLPARTQEPWPALRIDAVTGRRYADMLRARQARQWVKAAEIGKDVAARAPEFSLGRLQLAQTLALLGMVRSAQEHADAARALLQPLSVDAAELVDAQLLALTPPHEAAVAAYGGLSARYPAQTTFALEHARALLRAGRPADSLAVLSQPLWDTQPVGIQISRRLNRAAAELMLGDPARARDSARAADQLALAAGAGWEFERGFATLNLALADSYDSGGRSDTSLYEAAAEHFETAGDDMRALRARFLGETSRPMTTSSAHLDALLARARAAGFRQLEIEALRTVAFQQYRAGELAAYRARLEQAMMVADAIGDDGANRQLEVDLLNEDLLGGNFASADQRLLRLQKLELQGTMALWVDQFTAQMAFYGGRYPDALAALERGEQRARAGRQPNDPAPASAAMFACTRAAIVLIQGDPTQARAEYSRCGASGPSTKVQVLIGIAEIDLLSGDRDAAMRGLRLAHEELPAEPNLPWRWQLGLELAALQTRAGDTEMADQYYASVLPMLQSANYRLLEATARIGVAENAMAREDLAGARAQVDAARPLLPPGDWALTQRLSMLDIATARADGDAESAWHRLAEFDRAAHQRGDVLAQVRAHSLMSPSTISSVCSAKDRATLVARSGLRGATQAWLIQPVEDEDALQFARIELKF